MKAMVETPECSPCVDFGELLIIADEDDFGLRRSGVLEQLGELSCPDHARFVDDEDRAAVAE